MAQHHSLVDSQTTHRLEPYMERAIRLFLRLMGLLALVACLLFWLSLLIQKNSFLPIVFFSTP